MKKLSFFLLLISAFSFFLSEPLFAESKISPQFKNRHYKDLEWNIFPVPIFKTSPSEGETYGVLPVVFGTDPEGNLKSFVALAGMYNEVTGFDGFVAAYVYPDKDTAFDVFAEIAEHFSKELTVHFQRGPKRKGAFVLENELGYIQYPFERFYGFGPYSLQANESNFVSEKFTAQALLGYHLTRDIVFAYQAQFEGWKIQQKALGSLPDTLQLFPNDAEVRNSSHLLNTFLFTYDTHEDPVFPEHGEKLSLEYLFAHKRFGSDSSFHGYDLNSKITRSVQNGKYTTVLGFKFSQRFGKTIPFYLQSQLGGFETLRAFVERRFVARNRFTFDLEERIELASWNIMATNVEISLDPFFSIGQVFDTFSQVETSALQPVGGIGLRIKAKPSVVGRLDIGYGREGVAASATIDYPF